MSIDVTYSLSTKMLSPNQEHAIVVLLIDDQAIIAEAIKQMLEGQENLVFHYCNDPSQALMLAARIMPTVILLDLVMPDVEGLVLVKYFRANPLTNNIPLIVLSSKEDPRVKAEAFGCGANDYIVKLPDKVELIARIIYHSNSYIRLLERNEAYEKLSESQRILTAELSEAAEYVKSLLPSPVTGEITANWKFIPSKQLGGDIFGYHWIDEENFAIYLLDVCGHGIGAAMLSISVINVLSSQNLSETDFLDPKDVLSSLNAKFPMERHNQMFFTIWYGIYNKKKRTLCFSSGGHPPALLLCGPSEEQLTLHELTSKGMVVGGLPGIEFENGAITLQQVNRLFLFSDGVFEIRKATDEMMQFYEFSELVKKNKKLDPLFANLQQFHSGTHFDDDFSLLEVDFS